MNDSSEGFVQTHLPKYVNATWDPQTDITAYELALLLPLFIVGSTLTEEKWESLGSATRHIKRNP